MPVTAASAVTAVPVEIGSTTTNGGDAGNGGDGRGRGRR